ncbi:MAG: benzoate membrane transport protein, partial [Urechidicola sp.]
GITGWFEKIIDRIPLPIAAAMLAGILFQFGIDVFSSMETRLLLVGSMFVTYLLMKKMMPRYAIVIVLMAGLAICQLHGLLNFDDFEFVAVKPQFIIPAFSLQTLIGVGIPLFVVTMVSQNIPGIAVLRAAGYQTPLSPLISWTGFATLVLAPLGGYALNLAAITAAICTGEEAHEDPEKRYIATLSAGFFYLLLGLSGAAVVGLFNAFPTEFVLALAGLALIGTIANSLTTAVSETKTREAAIITFLVTASGMTIFGIGSAFWGLVAGYAALLIFRGRN